MGLAATPPSGGGFKTAIETLASGAWTQDVLASTATLNAPTSISCSSTGNCLALGIKFSGAGSSIRETGFYAAEVSGSWSTEATLPMLAPTPSSDINIDVASCAPNGPCTVLASESHATCCNYFTEVWTPGHGFTTSPTEMHFTGGVTSVDLSSISCPSTTSCVAVGSGMSNGRETGATSMSNSGVWGPVTALNDPTRTANDGLTEVSCASPGNCAAVGTSLDRTAYSEDTAWAVNLTAGTWRPSQMILVPVGIARIPIVENGISLLGEPNLQVSCAGTPMICSMVDTYFHVSVGPLVVAAQSRNGQWGQFTMMPLRVARGRQWELTSVSCVAAPSCAAAGASVRIFPKSTDVERSFQWVPAGGPSGRATAPRATIVSRTGVRVTWAMPVGGAPVDHYNVWASTGPVQRTYPLETKSMTVLLRGLTLPHTTYAIRIQAIGRDGQAMSPVAAPSITTP